MTKNSHVSTAPVASGPKTKMASTKARMPRSHQASKMLRFIWRSNIKKNVRKVTRLSLPAFQTERFSGNFQANRPAWRPNSNLETAEKCALILLRGRIRFGEIHNDSPTRKCQRHAS